MATSLGRSCIDVPDMERAVAFDYGAIGLAVENRIEQGNSCPRVLGGWGCTAVTVKEPGGDPLEIIRNEA